MSKAIISVTDAAAEKIKAIISKRDKEALGIRVGVKKGGCSGLEYVFEFADQEKIGDEKVIDKDVTIYIDPAAVLYLIGTTLDYHEDIKKSGFTFVNPNEKGRCGCGESFKV